jgi:hypothetical protein
VGGIALIIGAVAFIGVFSFLAARFDYPAILDGTAADVLPRLLATGPTGRAVWALYGFLPLAFHWQLAQAYAGADEPAREVIAGVFSGLNSYLGNYIGEFLGELSVSVSFLLSALAILDPDSPLPRWMAYLGLVTAAAGLIGMFRNVTGVVAPIAEVNNYLLPLWMIVFGVGLLRVAGRTA